MAERSPGLCPWPDTEFTRAEPRSRREERNCTLFCPVAPGLRARYHSGINTFRDLDFSHEEAAILQIRANLMAHLRKVIQAEKLTQAKAAKLLGSVRPVSPT